MENIQELLENKAFEALTAQERMTVLDVVSMAEYKEMRAILNQSKTTFQQINYIPDPLIKQKLQQQFKEKNRATFPFVSWLMMPIPIWVMWLGWGILGSLCYYFYTNQEIAAPIIQKETEQVVVYKTDTIYLEKIIPAPKIKKNKPPKTNKRTPKKEPSKVIRPIAKKEIEPSHLMEQALTYYDSSAIQQAQEQTIGHKLSVDMPNIQVKVR